MENKKGLFAGIHRDGYTWKDSMIVSIFLFFMMIIVGSGILKGLELLKRQRERSRDAR